MKNLLFTPKKTNKGVINKIKIIFSNNKVEFMSLNINITNGSIKKIKKGYEIKINPINGITRINKLVKIFLSLILLFLISKKLNIELDNNVIIIV
tara:strand:+ start:2323 stop:2607 length:285 start_codon:yes stop_codon:yes gene_type:complete